MAISWHDIAMLLPCCCHVIAVAHDRVQQCGVRRTPNARLAQPMLREACATLAAKASAHHYALTTTPHDSYPPPAMRQGNGNNMICQRTTPRRGMTLDTRAPLGLASGPLLFNLAPVPTRFFCVAGLPNRDRSPCNTAVLARYVACTPAT